MSSKTYPASSIRNGTKSYSYDKAFKQQVVWEWNARRERWTCEYYYPGMPDLNHPKSGDSRWDKKKDGKCANFVYSESQNTWVHKNSSKNRYQTKTPIHGVDIIPAEHFKPEQLHVYDSDTDTTTPFKYSKSRGGLVPQEEYFNPEAPNPNVDEVSAWEFQHGKWQNWIREGDLWYLNKTKNNKHQLNSYLKEMKIPLRAIYDINKNGWILLRYGFATKRYTALDEDYYEGMPDMYDETQPTLLKEVPLGCNLDTPEFRKLTTCRWSTSKQKLVPESLETFKARYRKANPQHPKKQHNKEDQNPSSYHTQSAEPTYSHHPRRDAEPTYSSQAHPHLFFRDPPPADTPNRHSQTQYSQHPSAHQNINCEKRTFYRVHVSSRQPPRTHYIYSSFRMNHGL